MKNLSLLFSILTPFLGSCLFAANLSTADSEPATQEAAELLEHWLDQAPLKEESLPRIVIGLREASSWPSELTEPLSDLAAHPSKEAYLVTKGRDGTLYVVGQTYRAMTPAVAGLLGDLGFRWYFPTPHWWVLPETASPVKEGVFAPAFSRRTIFGTGGMGPGGLPPDPNLKMRDLWTQWLKLNRFGGIVAPTGHAGDSIAHRHRSFFEENPHLRAQVNGKPVSTEKSFHFNYGHPDLQEWYVENRLEELARLIEKDPETVGISTDPADGPLPHCESPESLALGPLSNRIFTLSNLTARAVAKQFPGKVVGVNAYNRHAAPPTFPLEPNIYVQIVPYAFHDTGLTAEDLIKAWKKTGHPQLGVYDYWAITDWALCQPTLDYNQTLPAKLRFWHQQGLTGVGVESSFASGVIGLPVWIVSQLYWDLNADEKQLADEFFAQMFGPAEPPIRRMLDRWGPNFRLHAQEMALSWRDLEEATRLAADHPAVQARLRDYIGYLFFLQHQLEFREAAETGNEPAAALRLIDAIWQIHESGMAQSYRMHRLIRRFSQPATQAILDKEWDPKKSDSPGWKSWKAREDGWQDAALAEGLKRYPLLYTPAYYDDTEMVAVYPFEFANSPWVDTLDRLGQSKLLVLKEAGSPPDLVQVRAFRHGGKAITEDESRRLSVLIRHRKSGKATTFYTTSHDWITLPLPAEEGIYELNVIPMGQVTYRVRATPEACLTTVEHVESRFPRSPFTFYVPPEMKEIAFHAPAMPKNGERVIALQPEHGEEIPTEPGTLKVIKVPEGESGKLWSMLRYAGNRAQQVTFLNGPRFYGLPGGGLLIPKDLTPHTAPPKIQKNSAEEAEDIE